MHQTRQMMERRIQGEFSWVDLAAKDLDEQTMFYEQLFGWTHVDYPTDVGPIYRMFVLGDARIAGASQMTPEVYPPGAPSMWNTYIYAEDVDDVARRATELGGRVTMPPMDVMTEGLMVGIQDPTGGMVFFWQPGEHGGAQLFGEPGSIIWNDLNTRDPENAVLFFSDLLGWEIEKAAETPTPYWTVKVAGNAQGGIMPMPEQLPPEVPPNWTVYFAVDDVAAATERARSLGGNVEMEPMDVGNTTFAVLSDPQGAVFSIMRPGEM